MERNKYVIKPVGDQAIQVIFEQKINETINGRVMALKKKLSSGGEGFLPSCMCPKSQPDSSWCVPKEAVRETIPGYAALVIYYDPMKTDFVSMKRMLEMLLSDSDGEKAESGKLVEIPVCYGGIYGEDLEFVAHHGGLTAEEVIRIHSGRDYRIYMMGFLPGFPYLGGLDARLETPRLSSPRTKIPAGSVGIGGAQTGIYPMESPGGWQLIGRTPLKLFDPSNVERLPYEAGDRLRFIPIDEAEFRRIAEEEKI